MTQPIADNSNVGAIDLGGDLSQLSSMLSHLDEAPVAASGVVPSQQRTIQLRLGMASSLFLALRARHTPTADHSARVALACSAWSLATDMTEQQRDELEIAALLHDVGKIGIPDSILRNPNSLTADQQAMLRNSRVFAEQILRSICASDQILAAVLHVGAWYDGGKPGFELSGHDIPVASRMIAIGDAFDSMTTDSVYRKALSRDRAIAELFHCAATQFDPTMVEHFASFQASDQSDVNARMTNRWLHSLTESASNRFWGLQVGDPASASQARDEAYFQERLFDSLQDGVIFVDANFRIRRWNRGCLQLTGLSAEAVCNEQWNPKLVHLRSEDGRLIREDDCPVSRTFHSSSPFVDHMMLKGRSGDYVPVEFQAIPVMGPDGVKLGVTIVMRDWSSEKDLKLRVERLHHKATRDPLTSVANRSEFDRVFAETVTRNLNTGRSCSLIICDIDNFKRVNDTHGHQAGDEVLVSFAAMLARSSRSGDLVARYGGEEFVMVCEDCGCAEAHQLAERIRLELSRTSFKQLAGQSITASFGVTEIQAGDVPETMLRRADRGLLEAKDAGRNRVVQLGAGMKKERAHDTSWLERWMSRSKKSRKLVETYLVNNVPLNLLAEKLRGFIADHDAQVLSLDDEGILLEISNENAVYQRRTNDRGTPLQMHISFVRREAPVEIEKSQSVLCVSVRPIRIRDRRVNALEAARHLISSFKSYLVIQDFAHRESDRFVPLNPADWQDALRRI